MTPEPLDAEARRIAEMVLRDPEAAQFLRGDSVEALLTDAHRVAGILDAIAEQQRPKPPPTNFDGGVRQTPPAPSDPVRDHDLGVLEIIHNWKQGGAGEPPDGWG